MQFPQFSKIQLHLWRSWKEKHGKVWQNHGVHEMDFTAVLPNCWGTCSHIPMTKTAEEMIDISWEALFPLSTVRASALDTME